MSDGKTVSPCFTPGTKIATSRGAVRVEALLRGDKVVTRDNGLQRIHWIGRNSLSRNDLAHADAPKPILVRAGAFGEGRPHRDMIVSPNHRFLVGAEHSPIELHGDEALIAARHLVDQRTVIPATMLGVSYIHILCSRHEVILADGVWTETFHPDDLVMRALGNAQRTEILELFPEVATIGAAQRFPAVRTVLQPRSRFEN